MSFVKSVFITFGSRILIIILGLISGIIVARTLGPEGKGIFAVLGVVIGIATQFGNLGLHASNTYFIAKDKTKTPQILGNSLWVGLVIGSAISLVIYWIAKIYPTQVLGTIDPLLLTITLISIPFLLLALFFQNILLGHQKIVLYNVVQVLNSLVVVIGVVALLLFSHIDILNLIILSTVIGIATAIVYWILIAKDHDFDLKFNPTLFRETFKYGIKSYVAAFLAYLILRSDMYILNLLGGTSDVGIYSLAVGFADMILILPAAIAAIFFPKVSAMSEEQKIEITAKLSRYTSAIIFAICLFSAFIAQPLIIFLYGKSFSGAFLPFLILLPAIYFWSLTNIISQYFASRDFPIITVLMWVPGLLINIILNILWIPLFGYMGAAVASLVAYTLIFLLHYLYFRKLAGKDLVDILFIKSWEVGDILERAKALKKS